MSTDIGKSPKQVIYFSIVWNVSIKFNYLVRNPTLSTHLLIEIAFVTTGLLSVLYEGAKNGKLHGKCTPIRMGKTKSATIQTLQECTLKNCFRSINHVVLGQ